MLSACSIIQLAIVGVYRTKLYRQWKKLIIVYLHHWLSAVLCRFHKNGILYLSKSLHFATGKSFIYSIYTFNNVVMKSILGILRTLNIEQSFVIGIILGKQEFWFFVMVIFIYLPIKQTSFNTMEPYPQVESLRLTEGKYRSYYTCWVLGRSC